MSTADWLLLVNLICTGYMTGVIWLVQLVHYPMFLAYDRAEFSRIMREHQSRTFRVVFLPMLIELITAYLLLFISPVGVDYTLMILSAVLATWWAAATAHWQIPLHEKLEQSGYDAAIIAQLVRSNWLRTAIWTVRLLLMATIVTLTWGYQQQ